MYSRQLSLCLHGMTSLSLAKSTPIHLVTPPFHMRAILHTHTTHTHNQRVDKLPNEASHLLSPGKPNLMT